MSTTGTVVPIQSVPISAIHSNTELTIIQVTEDKLRLALNEHLDVVERKTSWQTPVSLVVAIALTLLTADFHDAGLEKSVWKALFIFCLIASIAWSVWAARQARVSITVDDLIRRIKNQRAGSP